MDANCVLELFPFFAPSLSSVQIPLCLELQTCPIWDRLVAKDMRFDHLTQKAVAITLYP